MGVFLGCFSCTRIQGDDDHDDETQIQSNKAIGLSKISVCEEKTEELSWVLKRFSWDEIERLTSSFSEVIGIGGFSTVYLARFPDSSFGAVKIYNCSERLTKVFNGELEINSQLCHQNIVTILGYCDERDEGVLVFEYIPNGDLQEKLHKNTTSQVLPWKTRKTIAFQLARALEYLHEKCSPQIVHGDVKSSNILLNLDDNPVSCKLCDFGFAKTGFSSSVKSSTSSRIAMMGSPGYIDPHYLMTGIASKKSDVYSFGVVLLELITGLDAFCPKKEKLLTSIVRTNNKDFDIEKVVELIDPRLGVGFDVKEVRAMACISGMCLHHLPSLRPSATEICQAMQESLSSLSYL
ncbi:hypothetical protein V2J09_004801 [Rumex salicifolius]